MKDPKRDLEEFAATQPRRGSNSVCSLCRLPSDVLEAVTAAYTREADPVSAVTIAKYLKRDYPDFVVRWTSRSYHAMGEAVRRHFREDHVSRGER